jgi:hypothetical protein
MITIIISLLIFICGVLFGTVRGTITLVKLMNDVLENDPNITLKKFIESIEKYGKSNK